MKDSYTFEYLENPIVRRNGRKIRSFDWAIKRVNATEKEPENSVVFLFQSYPEGRTTYDLLIK